MNRILDYDNLSKQIQYWIVSYAHQNNIKSLVVGVSGGIDSAVVSKLCAETGLPTIVVTMPIHSSAKNTKLSEQHASQLNFDYPDNVTWIDVDLTSTFDKFQSTVDTFASSELGYANTKSRLRMITLYQIAASNGGIVVGTGNKVEDFGVGFYTKYGDGGVDISPIADLYKTEVRNLGKFLEVDDEIINAAPTDGLWDDDRNDETQIGATYDELEWVMELGLEKFSYTEKEHRVVETYKKFNKKNKHKMVSIPIFDLKEHEII